MMWDDVPIMSLLMKQGHQGDFRHFCSQKHNPFFAKEHPEYPSTAVVFPQCVGVWFASTATRLRR